MNYDPKNIPNSDLPKPGKYLCSVKDAEETKTVKSIDMVKARLEILEGEHTGKIITDYMTFNCDRPKLFYTACGLISGKEQTFNFDTEKVKGRILYVMTYLDKNRLKVVYNGYSMPSLEVIEKALEKQKEKTAQEEAVVDPGELEKLYKQYNL